MFNDLLEIADSLNFYVMNDLHLNNLVMNLNNDGLLLIDTIPVQTTLKDDTNTIDEVQWEFE